MGRREILALSAASLLPFLAACAPQVIGAQPAETAVSTALQITPQPAIVASPTPEPSCLDQTRNPAFGFRTDLASPFMEIAAENSKIVRISYDNLDINKFLDILKNAQNKCLEPVIVFNPTRYTSSDQTQVKMEIGIIMYFAKQNYIKNYAFELGNEPDEKYFWQGGYNNFSDFASFVSDSIETIKTERDPDSNLQIVIAALVDPARYAPSYLDALQKQNVDLHNVIFAVHAYNTSVDLINKTEAMRQALQNHGVANPRIWVTELGAKDDNRKNMTSLLDTAKKLMNEGKIERVYIHELPDTEKWGFAEFPNGEPNQFYQDVAKWLKQ